MILRRVNRMSTSDDNIQELSAQAIALDATINRLNEDIGAQVVKLSYMAKRNRHIIWGLGISLLLNIVLTILMGFSFNAVHNNTTNIKQLTGRLNIPQTVQRHLTLRPSHPLLPG